MTIIRDKNGISVDLHTTSLWFDDEITTESVGNLIAQIEAAEKAAIIKLYITSPGGMVGAMHMLVDHIENSDKIFSIVVIESVQSAALDFILRAAVLDNVEIAFMPTAYGMAHDIDIGYSYRNLKNPRSLSSFLQSSTDELSRIYRASYMDLLTDEELFDYDRGQDIYISKQRLEEYCQKDKIPGFTNFFMSEGNILDLPDADFADSVSEEDNEESEQEVVATPKVRGFEPVVLGHRKVKDVEPILPKRGTKNSACYDFYSNEDAEIKPGESKFFAMDIKAYMLPDEVLKIYVRSSVGIKKNLSLKNGTGVIDSDYYSNEDNDGNIGAWLKNTGLTTVYISKGERIVQGEFAKYLTVDDENIDELDDRTGGTGSTNK